jgi:ArsR family transcriptional regulator
VSERAKRATKYLKIMANETRLRVLCRLVEGEKSVSQLGQSLGIRQTTLSQHLARLRDEDLVQTRRESKTIYYSLVNSEAVPIIWLLYTMYCRQQDALGSD